MAIPQERFKKRAAFDVFRAVAVSMVVLGHFTSAAQDLPPLVKRIGFAIASYGIPLFFIISGFLLAASLMSILKEKQYRVRVSVGVFFIKRILRIYPAYIVSLVILALYQEAEALDVWVHFLNLHNLFSGFNRSINEVYWTLAVEFQWYLVAPWCILFFVNNRARVVLFVVLVSMVLSFLIRWSIVYEYMHQTICLSDLVRLGQDQLYIHLFNFLIGVMLYKFRDMPVRIPVIGMIFLAFLLFWIGYIESGLATDLAHYHGQLALYKVLLSYFSIIILAVMVACFLNLEIMPECYRIISFISTISYSLYIYHLPILKFIGNYNISWNWFFPIYLLSSVAIAFISYYAIERPFLRYSGALTS